MQTYRFVTLPPLQTNREREKQYVESSAAMVKISIVFKTAIAYRIDTFGGDYDLATKYSHSKLRKLFKAGS